MKFNIKKLDLFQQLGFLIIFCMMSSSVQATCKFTTAEPVTVTQTTDPSVEGTQFYYLFDCDGNLIAGENTTVDFGLQPYGCYEIYALNACDGIAPSGIASSGDITSLPATDYDNATTGEFTVCDVSQLGTAENPICEYNFANPNDVNNDNAIVSVVTEPNSYETSNDMTYVLVCSIDNGPATISGSPVTVTAGSGVPAQAAFPIPADNDLTVDDEDLYFPECTVYVLNSCPTVDLSALVDGADWATVDPTGNPDVASIPLTVNVENCVGLPLNLVSFTADCEEGEVSLEWITVSEENVKHMVVQRTMDGGRFTDMDVIPARANGLPVETTYNYVDAKPLGRGIYRLKVVDMDGSFEYTPLIQVSCSKGGFDFTEVFPNPTRKDITVNFEIQDLSAIVTVQLVDVLGRVVHEEEVIPAIGINSSTIDMSKLGPAVYTVILDDGNHQITRRVAKN